jgi:hypothetical protein
MTTGVRRNDRGLAAQEVRNFRARVDPRFQGWVDVARDIEQRGVPPSQVERPDPMVVADPIAKVAQQGDGMADQGLVAAWCMREARGQVRPEEAVAAGDDLMPETEGEFGEDLVGSERFGVGSDVGHGARDVRVGMMVTAGTGRVTTEFSRIVEDPMVGSAETMLADSHLAVDDVAEGNLERAEGLEEGG